MEGALGSDQRTRGPVPPGVSFREGLLGDLHEGRTSRNRDYERFLEPAAHRVWRSYRLLAGLAAELRQPGVEVRIVRSRQGQQPAVEVRIRRLRYHRLVLLSSWEFDFLRTQMLGGALLEEPPLR
jgi:hypothetical protein